MTPAADASSLVTYGIGGLAVVVAAITVLLVHRANPRASVRFGACVLALMIVQFGLAKAGILARWNQFPPPFMPMMVVTLGLSAFAAMRWGGIVASAFSYAVLIGVQAFRLPLELVMHQAAVEHVMPAAMSFSGRNFDIVTGATAIIVALLAALRIAPRWLLIVWNLAGSLLLLNIVCIAVACTPRFQAFGPEQLNTWVAEPPFVWLPGVLVTAAMVGHIVIWRKLRGTAT